MGSKEKIKLTFLRLFDYSPLGYLAKLKRSQVLAFGAHFLDDFFRKNVPYLILYQWTKFQCHTFFPSQDIKKNVLLSSYLGS